MGSASLPEVPAPSSRVGPGWAGREGRQACRALVLAVLLLTLVLRTSDLPVFRRGGAATWQGSAGDGFQEVTDLGVGEGSGHVEMAGADALFPITGS